MLRYKLSIASPATEPNNILKIEEGLTTAFPMDEDNRDYREYLLWVAEGNTPEPADE